MQGKISIRLAILAALAALVAVIVPAGLASGDSAVIREAGIIYLSMGNGPTGDVITYDGLADQPIPTKKNDCTEIDKLSVDGANSILVVKQLNSLKLGESKDHIGALGPNDGSGEPCALAAAGAGVNGANEGISVKIGPAADGVLMKGFSIDVRLKGTGATVQATFWRDNTEVTMGNPEDFQFTQAADSGPDSADNYRWTPDLGETTYFDEVRFEAIEGAFALGGGVESDVPGEFDTSSHASQFLTVKEYDGEITCGDEREISDPAVPSISGFVTLHAMDSSFTGDPLDSVDPDPLLVSIDKGSLDYPPPDLEWGDGSAELEPCVLKPYNAALGFTDNTEGDGIIDESELTFVPELAETVARYTLEITVRDQEVTTDGSGQITSLQAEYNPAGDLTLPGTRGLQACTGLLPDGSTADPWTAQDLDLLPDGEFACYYHASVTPTGTKSDGVTVIGTESWGVFFLDDPSVRFK